MEKPVLALLDSCFSGKSRVKGEEIKAIVIRPPKQLEKQFMTASGKAIIISATHGDRFANTYPRSKHGLFTHYLLQGLNGAGDTNQDGNIGLQELFKYVHDGVTKTAGKITFRPQEPEIYNPTGTDMTLTKVR